MCQCSTRARAYLVAKGATSKAAAKCKANGSNQGYYLEIQQLEAKY